MAEEFITLDENLIQTLPAGSLQIVAYKGELMRKSLFDKVTVAATSVQTKGKSESTTTSDEGKSETTKTSGKPKSFIP